MERRRDDAAVAHEHRLAFVLGENFHVPSGHTHARGTDEDAAQRSAFAGERKISLEARDLAAVGVSIHLDVDEPEMVAIEHDHAGTRPQDRTLERADRLVEPIQAHEAHKRRRLTAGTTSPSDPASCSGLRTSIASTPSRRSIAACSRKVA